MHREIFLNIFKYVFIIHDFKNILKNHINHINLILTLTIFI